MSANVLTLLGMPPGVLSGAEALDRLRLSSPAAYTTLLQWSSLCGEVAEASRVERKREVVAGFLRRQYHLPERRTLDQIYRRLRREIRAAQRALAGLFTEYLPPDILHQVMPRKLRADPLRLLETGLPMSAGGQLSFALEQAQREQFEARRALILGLLFFDITVNQWTGEDPPGDPAQMTSFLVDQSIFAARPTAHTLVSWHDPADEYRCVGVEGFFATPAKAGLQRRETKVVLATLIQNGQRVPIIYNVRKKLPLSLIRRMLVDAEWNHERVRDLRAFRFCYATAEDLLACYGAVASKLAPGGIGNVKDRFTQGAENPNRHSARDFRGIKHEARIGGRVYEVDHLLTRTWLDITYSRAGIRHELYHARQMCEVDPPGLFRCVLPSLVYGYDWESEDTRAKIRAHLLASSD